MDVNRLTQRIREWFDLPIEGHGLYARYEDARMLLGSVSDALDAAQAENTRLTEINLEMFGKSVDLLNERDRLARQVAYCIDAFTDITKLTRPRLGKSADDIAKIALDWLADATPSDAWLPVSSYGIRDATGTHVYKVNATREDQ